MFHKHYSPDSSTFVEYKDDENINTSHINLGIEKSKDDQFISAIESLLLDIDDLERDINFKEILILKDGSDYYVCGRLFLMDSNQVEKLEKFKLDIEIKHKMVPPLYGFATGDDPSDFFEIRKIPFEPHPLTKEIISKATKSQLLVIISQFLDLANYISKNQHSISLLTLEDFFSCCFIDSSSNLYFGDLCFIEVENFPQKNLYSTAILIYQLLGGEIDFNDGKIMPKHAFDFDISPFWQNYISICWINNVDIKCFRSSFMKNIKNKIYFPPNELKSDLNLDFDEDQLIEAEIKMKEAEDCFISESEAREIVNRYQSLRYIPISGKKSNKFEFFKTNLKEDGSQVFDIKIKRDSIEEAVSILVANIEIQHPMVLPLTGFSCDESTLKTFHLYKEMSFLLRPVTFDELIDASDDQKIKWAKQMSDFTVYLIENTCYKIVKPYLIKEAAFDQSNNIVFINIDLKMF